MSDVKISGLPSSTGVTPASDFIPIVHNGTTEKITPDQLIGGSGFVTTTQLNAGLAPKADTSTVNSQLALKADLAALAATTGAGLVGITPTGNIASTTVAAALNELDSEKTQATTLAATGGAALVGFAPTGTLASTNVQAAIAEINTDLASSTGAFLVGFNQSGTSVTRTVRAKLIEERSVLDFGAVGDGSTDDSPAIALAALWVTGSASGTSPITSFTQPARRLVFPANLRYKMSSGVVFDFILGTVGPKNGFSIIMNGPIVPDAGIGDAITIKNIYDGEFKLWVRNGGTTYASAAAIPDYNTPDPVGCEQAFVFMAARNCKLDIVGTSYTGRVLRTKMGGATKLSFMDIHLKCGGQSITGVSPVGQACYIDGAVRTNNLRAGSTATTIVLDAGATSGIGAGLRLNIDGYYYTKILTYDSLTQTVTVSGLTTTAGVVGVAPAAGLGYTITADSSAFGKFRYLGSQAYYCPVFSWLADLVIDHLEGGVGAVVSGMNTVPLNSTNLIVDCQSVWIGLMTLGDESFTQTLLTFQRCARVVANRVFVIAPRIGVLILDSIPGLPGITIDNVIGGGASDVMDGTYGSDVVITNSYDCNIKNIITSNSARPLIIDGTSTKISVGSDIINCRTNAIQINGTASDITISGRTDKVSQRTPGTWAVVDVTSTGSNIVFNNFSTYGTDGSGTYNLVAGNDVQIIGGVYQDTPMLVGASAVTSNVLCTGSTNQLVNSISVKGVSTENKSLTLGAGRAGDGNSFIDLIGDSTYSTYGLRVLRNPGANGASAVTHRGTGNFRFQCTDLSVMDFYTNTLPVLSLLTNQDVYVQNKISVGVSGATSTLTVNGPISVKRPTTVSGTTYTQLAIDSTIICTNSGTCTITLLSAASYPGQVLNLKAGTATTVITSASSNIVPANSVTTGTAIMASGGKFVTLQSDATNWIVIMAV